MCKIKTGALISWSLRYLFGRSKHSNVIQARRDFLAAPIAIDNYDVQRSYALTSSLLLFLTLRQCAGLFGKAIYAIFAIAGYDNWNSVCKYQWSSNATSHLIDGQTAFGYTRNLTYDQFV